jgi:hypothetical protein
VILTVLFKSPKQVICVIWRVVVYYICWVVRVDFVNVLT